MVDRSQPSEATESEDTVSPPAAPRRPSGGYRSTDARDTVAEMAARAQEISMEAGSKVAAAMKDVINAAAGLTGFALESARDLVQYMIRRGQMTPEEGEKLLREAEDAYSRRAGAVPAMPAASANQAVRPATVTATMAPTADSRTESRTADSRTVEPRAPESRAPEPRAATRATPARGVDTRAAGTKTTAGATRPAARKTPAATSAKRPAHKAAPKAASRTASKPAGARAKAPASRAKAAAKSRPAAKKKR